ncbi:trypsin-like peptidase domain-containing protein, partial [Streptosporangium sp. NPDC023963]|uniref:trypsin-like peptidase domain-containing protein n=1 Tax=Streptosporangium sp. NPDC023963 TaxID=3155608 RepID=UPI00342079DB
MALQDAAEGAIQDRFVEVLADLGPGARPRWRCASGFLVDGRHVLTSLHAVIGGELTVRRAGDAPGGPKREWPARLLLAGDLEGADLAILTLEQDAGPLRPAGYAQVARRTPQPVVIERCSAVGFPRFTARSDAEDAVRDSAHVEGRIPTSQNLVSGLLTLQTTHTPQPLPPARSGLSASAWSGMSGAAVLAGGRIIAVVSEHAPRQGPSDLTVVPITLIDTLPEADAWWAVLATRPALLPTLPPPAPPPAPASVISQPPGQLLEHVTDPFDLEVHRPIRVIGHGGDLPALPRYVRRAHDDQLAAITARAQAGHSGLAVLVGGSSTGKTRACWEALTVLRRSGQGWRLWHPIDPTRPEAALAALAEVGPYTVVWLNEAQFYLSPDGLGDKVAAGLRALLRDPTRGPVLIMATLWPEHWSTLTTRPVGGEDPHAQARELLADRKIHLPDAFTDHDSRHLADAAAADPRLAEARHHAAEGKITQYLAGVPVLLDRYSEAPPAARALIHAAMDARRLGHGPHLPYQLLAEAAPGYLTDTEWNDVDDDWLEAALAYTAQPCNGIPGPLTRIRPRTPAPGPPVYRLADYLEQTGRTARAGHYPPETFWTAATQLTSADTLHTLGHAARNRGLLQTAAHLWKHATRLGHPEAALHLTTLLTHAHPHDQRPARYAARHATLDDPRAIGRLLDGLQRAGADEQVALLADRAARHATLDDPDTVGRLLDGLQRAGADEQVALLADRAARHAALDDPDTVGRLLDRLRRAGTNEQIALLLGRDPARHTALDDPDSVGYLLDSLREAGADEQIAALADRAARHATLDDPDTVGRLLDSLRRAGANEQIALLLGRDPARHTALDDPRSVGYLLDSLREAGADEQIAALADRAIRHTAVDDPRAIGRLLDSLRRVDANEQIAALLGRDPARHATLDDLDAIGRLLDSLQEAGAHEQVALLADRAARHIAVDDP